MTLDASIRDHVPVVVLRRQYPPWFNAEVRHALREKETSFNRTKRNRNPDTVRDFREKRQLFKDISCFSYFKYIRGLIGDFKSNPKRFWSFLKVVKGSKGQLPVLLDGEREVSDDTDKANLLNRTFANKFTDPEVNTYPDTPAYDIPHLDRFVITEASVRGALRDLQTHKACGPDNISARIIKECSDQLVVPLSLLFNKSVCQGVFPSRWAEANVVPIHKKGPKKCPSNYRAVSLLPLFGKLLERCVCDALFLHVQPVLTDKQHGFLPRRSCDTNLACLLKTAWDSIASGHQTDVIYTDYSAAFQSVNHKLLVYKLQNSYQITGDALNWLSSYLANRKQRVIVNGKCSEWTPVRSGTPEGSILSPLLFALFVNDLSDTIKTNCLLFADDVKIYHKIVTVQDTKLLQADLSSLVKWSKDWKLQLNPVKCKTFTITLKRKPIHATYKILSTALENVTKIRDLGVWLDTKLTFGEHIDTITSKANRALGVMIRTLQSNHTAGRLRLKSEPLLAAYFGNIRSILEFGCVIWGGAARTNLDRLEKIQHKFLIWLASTTCAPTTSLAYVDLLKLFKITSLTNRRHQYDVLFVHKILTGNVDSALLLGNFPLHVPARNTRAGNRTLLHIPHARVETIKSGLFCRTAYAMNSYLSACQQADIFRCTYSQFRSQVRSYVKLLPW